MEEFIDVPTRAALIDRAIAEARGVETAADVVSRVSPETREAATRVAIAQAVQDVEVDVEPVLFADPAAQRTAVLDLEPPGQRLADPSAVAATAAPCCWCMSSQDRMRRRQDRFTRCVALRWMGKGSSRLQGPLPRRFPQTLPVYLAAEAL